MDKKIRKAVIPAAGYGTRFLPVTKALAKEMLPIVDTPAIQYIVEEAIQSGIEELDKSNQPLVFVLWGNPAQKKANLLHNPNHLVLFAPHPSPLSAYRGFFGCKHFSKANRFLIEKGKEPIDWQIENI